MGLFDFDNNTKPKRLDFEGQEIFIKRLTAEQAEIDRGYHLKMASEMAKGALNVNVCADMKFARLAFCICDKDGKRLMKIGDDNYNKMLDAPTGSKQERMFNFIYDEIQIFNKIGFLGNDKKKEKQGKKGSKE